MIRHVTASIDAVLSLSDDELMAMFDGKAADIRAELQERKAQGEKKIGSIDCEGFDPVKGCPGHPDKN